MGGRGIGAGTACLLAATLSVPAKSNRSQLLNTATLLATIACALPAAAQYDETAKSFHLLPHLADGGGWQSILLVTNVSLSASSCTFNVYGMPLNRFNEISGITAAGSTATFQLKGPGGYLIWPTKNELAAVASGYATLDCSAQVTAQILFASFGGSGVVTGMATVFSSQAATVFQFPVLQPAALGFAVANDTNAEASCRIVLEDTQRTNLGEATLSVPAKSNRSQLLNTAISIPGTFSGGSATVSCNQPVAMIGLHFELRPDGTIITFSTLPPAILSTNRQQTERIIGTWVFSYSIGSSDFSNTYRLSDDVRESSSTPGRWYIHGTDEYGDLVLAGYSPRLEEFSLLDPGITIDLFFTFNFVGSNTVAGCFYLHYKDDGSLSRCYPMTGVRTSSSTLSSLKRALLNTTAAQAELVEIEEAKKLGIEMQIEVDPKIIRVLEDLREVLRQ